MLPRTDPIAIKPVGQVEGAPSVEGVADARQEAFQRSLAGLLGKSLQGEILSKLTDGSYLVKVAGASARMLLPAGAQVGSEVPLTLVALSPRPVFQIRTGQGQGGAAALAYSEAGPALLPGPAGAAARAAPLVYLEGGPVAAPPLPAPGTLPARAAIPPGTPAPAAALVYAEGDAAAAPALPEAGVLPAKLPAGAPAAAADAPLLHEEAGPAPETSPLPGALPAKAAAAALAGGQPETPAAAAQPGAGTPPAGAGPARLPALPGTAPQPVAAGPAPQLVAAGPAPQPAAAGPAPLRSHVQGALLLGRAPLTPAALLPALDPGATPALLSDGGKVIASVLGTALRSENAPTAIVARTPLLATPAAAAMPQRVAAALKEAIGASGLFYESHVAEWVEGKRPLADLVREPQMQKALNSSAPEVAARQQAPASDPPTAQFINLQLNTHEQARVAWEGQVWPGQPMRWEIQKDAPDGREDDATGAAPPTWRSKVRFRFPLLGEIGATVVLVGDQLHIQVQAGSTDVGALLREHAGALGAAMEAAGSALSSLNIRAGQGSAHE